MATQSLLFETAAPPAPADDWKQVQWGYKQYVYQNSAGQVRFSVRCKFCKKREHLALDAYKHRTTGDWIAADVATIAHRCERLEKRLAHELAYWLRPDGTPTLQAERWYSARLHRIREDVTAQFLRDYAFTAEPFVWTDTGADAHTCSAKCVNATGPSCECHCKGRNHGGGWS